MARAPARARGRAPARNGPVREQRKQDEQRCQRVRHVDQDLVVADEVVTERVQVGQRRSQHDEQQCTQGERRERSVPLRSARSRLLGQAVGSRSAHAPILTRACTRVTNLRRCRSRRSRPATGTPRSAAGSAWPFSGRLRGPPDLENEDS